MRKGVEVKSVGPLTSWDIFVMGYRRSQQLADDRNVLEKMNKAAQWNLNFDFRKELFQFGKTILVTTPSQRIIYASSSLYAMSGYLPQEVIGHTPRMFQGRETKDEIRAYVREAIMEPRPFETTVTNYRKDGSAYNCHISGYPLFNTSRQLVHFIAFEHVT